jgi:hypothetical protein
MVVLCKKTFIVWLTPINVQPKQQQIPIGATKYEESHGQPST